MKELKEIFGTHKRVVLFYSGGKDSLATLLLLKPYWKQLRVVWVNTGNQFPELVHHMAMVRTLIPHFEEICTDVPKFFAENGFPVDVVPVKCTNMGHYIYGDAGLKVCNAHDCCFNNIWLPMTQYVSLIGADCVIRGDRGEERIKGETRGNGVDYVFPIFDWSREQVLETIRDSFLYEPRHEMEHGSSLDCQICMAYNDDIACKLKYTKEYHPELYEKSKRFFKIYQAHLYKELSKLSEQ